MRNQSGNEKIQLVCLCVAVFLVIALWVTRNRGGPIDCGRSNWKIAIRNVSRVDANTIDVIVRLRNPSKSLGIKKELRVEGIERDLLRQLHDHHQLRESYNMAKDNKATTKKDAMHYDRNYVSNNRSITKTKTIYPLTIYSQYLIKNEHICSDKKTRFMILIVVHTATSHFERRRWLRETWANRNAYRNVDVRVIFLFGETNNKDAQNLIENESLIYGDVIQGQFFDSYKNLTNKCVLGLRWVSEHCKQADFIVKVDDDVYVNMFDVIENVYPVYGNKSRQLICHVRAKGTSPIGRGKTKWSVDESEFVGEKFYPTYCNGYAVFMTPDVIGPMFRVATHTPFFWIDDVYMFGLLPRKVGGFTWVNFVKKFTLVESVGLESYVGTGSERYIVSTARKRTSMESMWFGTLKRLSMGARRFVNPFLLQSVDDVIRDEGKTPPSVAKKVSRSSV